MNEWADSNHSKEVRTVGFEIDQPPPGTDISLGVTIVSTSSYVPDADLTVKASTPSALLDVSGKTVSWGTSK